MSNWTWYLSDLGAKKENKICFGCSFCQVRFHFDKILNSFNSPFGSAQGIFHPYYNCDDYALNWNFILFLFVAKHYTWCVHQWKPFLKNYFSLAMREFLKRKIPVVISDSSVSDWNCVPDRRCLYYQFSYLYYLYYKWKTINILCHPLRYLVFFSQSN